MDFIGTDSQLTGIVAVGFANEAPPKDRGNHSKKSLSTDR